MNRAERRPGFSKPRPQLAFLVLGLFLAATALLSSCGHANAQLSGANAARARTSEYDGILRPNTGMPHQDGHQIPSGSWITGSADPQAGELSEVANHMLQHRRLLTCAANADRVALLAVKAALGNPASFQWSDCDPCRWENGPATVACDGGYNTRVTNLNIDYPNPAFSGTIPPEFFDLTELQWVNINGNFISGTLPDSFDSLPNLVALFLYENQLSGTFPSTLALHSNLMYLGLSTNFLSGTLQGAAANLVDLFLDDNFFSGTIPDSLFTPSDFQHLDMGFNYFSGTIPSLAGLPILSDLDLEDNYLSGTVPFLTFPVTLVSLELSDNALSGTLPAEVVFLSVLEYININSNRFSGTIPATTNARLNYINLSDNPLSGTIPVSVSALTSLQRLYLRNDSLSGTIPDVSALTSLQRVDVSNNHLSGAIPGVSTLTSLERLNMSRNAVSGVIPTLNAGYLRNLDILDISYNQLSGYFPQDTTSLDDIDEMNLSHNRFSGTIPSICAVKDSLDRLFLSDNALSGYIPGDLGCMDELDDLYLDDNRLSGTISDFRALSDLNHLNLSMNALSGVIPTLSAAAGDLDELDMLDISYNQLSGFIPEVLDTLEELDELNLSHNRLSGTIPSLCAVSDSLDRLYLNDNALSGYIPCDLDCMVQLDQLDLSNNQLSGSIGPLPSTDLDHLDLSGNKLSGTMPSFSSLTELDRLFLNNNDLSGTISVDLGLLTALDILRLDSNHFFGTIPDELASLVNLDVLGLSDNQLFGSIPLGLGPLEDLDTLDVSNNSLICGPDPPANVTDPEPPQVLRNHTLGLTCPYCIDTLGGLGVDYNCSDDKPMCGDGEACSVNALCYFNATAGDIIPYRATCETDMGVDATAEIFIKHCDVTTLDLTQLASAAAIFFQFIPICAIELTTAPQGSVTRRHLLQVDDPSIVVIFKVYVEDPSQGTKLRDLMNSLAFRQFLAAFFDASVGVVQNVDNVLAVFLLRSTATSDPHFTTPHGQKFDFNGEANKTYCIVTDAALHVNAHFTGASAGGNELPAATSSPTRPDKRTWMDEVGILAGGVQVLVSAESPAGTGYSLSPGTVTVNGVLLNGRQGIHTLPSGMTILRKKTRVTVSMPHVATVGVEIVRASFWEGGKGPGKNFLNLRLMDFKPTSHVHGILGRAYWNETNGMLVEDPLDYQTSSILATDCHFGQYARQE